MSLFELFAQGDAVTRLVAALLLAMSVASWVVILWKAWLLRRASRRRRPQHRGLLAVAPPSTRAASGWPRSTARRWCCR